MRVSLLLALLSANSRLLMSFSRTLYLFICSQMISSTHLQRERKLKKQNKTRAFNDGIQCHWNAAGWMLSLALSNTKSFQSVSLFQKTSPTAARCPLKSQKKTKKRDRKWLLALLWLNRLARMCSFLEKLAKCSIHHVRLMKSQLVSGLTHDAIQSNLHSICFVPPGS